MIERIRAGLGAKLLLSLVLNVAVMGPYYLAKALADPDRVAFSPRTVVDDVVPFIPGTALLYLSLSLFVAVGPWLLTTRRELRRYALGVIMQGLLAFTAFVLYPTRIARPTAFDANAVYELLVWADSPVNAFPSLHVAMLLYHALWSRYVLVQMHAPGWVMPALWTWGTAIAISTLTTRQHTFVDVLGGIVLAISSWVMVRLSRGARDATEPPPATLPEPNYENQSYLPWAATTRRGDDAA